MPSCLTSYSPALIFPLNLPILLPCVSRLKMNSFDYRYIDSTEQSRTKFLIGIESLKSTGISKSQTTAICILCKADIRSARASHNLKNVQDYNNLENWEENIFSISCLECLSATRRLELRHITSIYDVKRLNQSSSKNEMKATKSKIIHLTETDIHIHKLL